MPIKAFVFDCGNVLLRDGDLAPYERWGERLGLAPDELAARLWEGELWARAERGELTDAEFWREAGASLGLDEAQAAALRDDLWSTWQVDDIVLSLIDRLREHHTVWMLSNATDGLEELLERRYGVADRFECVLNSARLGVAKPDKAIFEELLRQLALEPGEVVFVDDRAENVAAAAALGIHVIWYIHAKELERQLRPHLRREQAEPSAASEPQGQQKDGADPEADEPLD